MPPLEIQLWPEEVIALNKELSSGLHYKLEAIMHDLPEHITFAERIGHIAAYCELVLDGMYSADDIAGICGELCKRLEGKREKNPGLTIYLQ